MPIKMHHVVARHRRWHLGSTDETHPFPHNPSRQLAIRLPTPGLMTEYSDPCRFVDERAGVRRLVRRLTSGTAACRTRGRQCKRLTSSQEDLALLSRGDSPSWPKGKRPPRTNVSSRSSSFSSGSSFLGRGFGGVLRFGFGARCRSSARASMSSTGGSSDCEIVRVV